MIFFWGPAAYVSWGPWLPWLSVRILRFGGEGYGGLPIPEQTSCIEINCSNPVAVALLQIQHGFALGGFGYPLVHVAMEPTDLPSKGTWVKPGPFCEVPVWMEGLNCQVSAMGPLQCVGPLGADRGRLAWGFDWVRGYRVFLLG